MANFELTGGEDRIRATSGDDMITGGAATLDRFDTIFGGGGNDTLVAGLTNNLSGAEDPRIRGVENLFIDGQGGDLSLRRVSGAEFVFADQSDLVLEKATLDTAYGARGVESGTVTVNFRVDLSGSDDLLKLVSRDSNVTFKSSTDPANNAIERIELTADGTERDEEQVDISAFTSLEMLTVLGENRVVLDLTSPELTMVDATQNTGGVELNDLNSASQDVTILGSQGDDLFLTGTGNDVIEGQDGNDEIDAEAGDDQIFGGLGDDRINGNAGNDTIEGNDGNDNLRGAGGEDIIDGGAGNDRIRGGNNDDKLSGGTGDDNIRGGGGDDVIAGGSGENILNGGGGADMFMFEDGTDTVQDFVAGTDMLIFSDGTELSTQQDFIDLMDTNPDLFQSVEADSVTLDIGGATVTLLEFDTDFLMA
jgi:Ca2+-binding RTX toxin-like protein